jgi:hypothetical protein
MNTKLLLTTSAIAMGGVGTAASFAPAEIAGIVGTGSGVESALVLQLLGALLFSFATVNWMARGSLLGGIYNRPITVGNLAHFVIGALALAKAVAAGERRTVYVVATLIYLVFAVGFGAALLRSPVKRRDEAGDRSS